MDGFIVVICCFIDQAIFVKIYSSFMGPRERQTTDYTITCAFDVLVFKSWLQQHFGNYFALYRKQ